MQKRATAHCHPHLALIRPNDYRSDRRSMHKFFDRADTVYNAVLHSRIHEPHRTSRNLRPAFYVRNTKRTGSYRKNSEPYTPVGNSDWGQARYDIPARYRNPYRIERIAMIFQFCPDEFHMYRSLRRTPHCWQKQDTGAKPPRRRYKPSNATITECHPVSAGNHPFYLIHRPRNLINKNGTNPQSRRKRTCRSPI